MTSPDLTAGLLLTEVERDRFAGFLEWAAQSTEGLAKQVLRLGPVVGEILAEKLRAEAAAMVLVARWLRSWEPMTLGDFDA